MPNELDPNYGLGVQALRYWFNASGLANTGKGMPDVTDYYNAQDPNFIIGFGQTITQYQVDMSKVQQGMETLAAQDGPTFPQRQEFYGALASAAGTLNAADIGGALADSAATVAKVAGLGLSLYVVAGAVALGFLIFSQKELLGEFLREKTKKGKA